MSDLADFHVRCKIVTQPIILYLLLYQPATQIKGPFNHRPNLCCNIVVSYKMSILQDSSGSSLPTNKMALSLNEHCVAKILEYMCIGDEEAAIQGLLPRPSEEVIQNLIHGRRHPGIYFSKNLTPHSGALIEWMQASGSILCGERAAAYFIPSLELANERWEFFCDATPSKIDIMVGAFREAGVQFKPHLFHSYGGRFCMPALNPDVLHFSGHPCAPGSGPAYSFLFDSLPCNWMEGDCQFGGSPQPVRLTWSSNRAALYTANFCDTAATKSFLTGFTGWTTHKPQEAKPQLYHLGSLPHTIALDDCSEKKVGCASRHMGDHKCTVVDIGAVLGINPHDPLIREERESITSLQWKEFRLADWLNLGHFSEKREDLRILHQRIDDRAVELTAQERDQKQEQEQEQEQEMGRVLTVLLKQHQGLEIQDVSYRPEVEDHLNSGFWPFNEPKAWGVLTLPYICC